MCKNWTVAKPHSLIQVGTRLGILESMLDPLLQSVLINLEDKVDFPDTSRCESLLVDVNVTIVGTTIRGIHIKVNYTEYNY